MSNPNIPTSSNSNSATSISSLSYSSSSNSNTNLFSSSSSSESSSSSSSPSSSPVSSTLMGSVNKQQQPLASALSTSSDSSPEFVASSPAFNRWPLSDTPDGSNTNSPREFPLAGPGSYYSYGGSGSESLRTTPPGSNVSVPHLSISAAAAATDGQLHPPNHRSALASMSPMSSAISPSGTPVLAAAGSTSASPNTILPVAPGGRVPPIEGLTNSPLSGPVTTTTTTTRETLSSIQKSGAAPPPPTSLAKAASGTTTAVAAAAAAAAAAACASTFTIPHRRATTLDVPGLTRSRVSPNGYISQRDVGSKLVIVMVGLPARGKSYVTNKLCRYLNWQHHNTRIFNVGNTRRKANKAAGPASVPLPDSGPHTKVWSQPPSNHHLSENDSTVTNPVLLRGPGGYMNAAAKHEYELKQERYNNDHAAAAAAPGLNTDSHHGNQPSIPENDDPAPTAAAATPPPSKSNTEQTADFFSPDNPESFSLREKWAMDTLDDLLDYVVEGPGSVGILDATNTTTARRQKVLTRIKERSNGQLKVLYLESICSDYSIIERNIRLKLSGPDYKDCDTEVALKDFVDRMRNYEKVYEPITEDEDDSGDDFQYIKMIDVGKKVVCYNIKGFLAGQVVFFLLNFNLAERQIWITRHGESLDNAAGRIGGDSGLTPRGQKFAKALARFMDYSKAQFRKKQLQQYENTAHFLKKSDGGARTPKEDKEPEEPNFCVWTSMMKRSIDSAGYFDEDVYDIKEMRMLNELGAGICDGMTYPEIKSTYPQEYQARMADKISYRYPGPGGESYLDVINRLRPVIVEVERMTDNNLIIAHRVVCRILLAYFMNLGHDSIGDLDVPLHTLYCLEPKPYGVSWEAYEYDDKTDWFYRVPKETMLERSRRPSIAPQLAGRNRQYSVMPTTTAEVVPPVYANAAASHAGVGANVFGSYVSNYQGRNHPTVTASSLLAGPGAVGGAGAAAPGSVPIAIPVAAGNRRGPHHAPPAPSYGHGHGHTLPPPSSSAPAGSSSLPTVSELSARLNTLRGA